MTSNFAHVAVVPEEGVNARLPHLRKTSLLFTTLPVGLRSQTHRMLRMTIGCRGLSKKAQEPNRVVNGYIPVASRLHRPPRCTFRILILPARDLLLLSGQSDGIVTEIEDQLGVNPGVDRATILDGHLSCVVSCARLWQHGCVCTAAFLAVILLAPRFLLP